MRAYSSLDVEVPIQTAYEAWSHLERLPDYFPSLRGSEMVDAEEGIVRLRGPSAAWDVQLIETIPPHLLKWRDEAGRHAGTVRLYSRPDGSTKVLLELVDARMGDPREILLRFRERMASASSLLA